MSKKQRSEELFTNFSKWINRNTNLDSRQKKLDVQNIDYVFHQWQSCGVSEIEYFDDVSRKLMLIEEKCYMSKQDFPQRDTHFIIDQIMHMAHGKVVETMRGERIVDYYGYFIIAFEHTSPEDGEVFLNYRKITKRKLEKFLAFELPRKQYKCFFHGRKK